MAYNRTPVRVSFSSPSRRRHLHRLPSPLPPLATIGAPRGSPCWCKEGDIGASRLLFLPLFAPSLATLTLGRWVASSPSLLIPGAARDGCRRWPLGSRNAGGSASCCHRLCSRLVVLLDLRRRVSDAICGARPLPQGLPMVVLILGFVFGSSTSVSRRRLASPPLGRRPCLAGCLVVLCCRGGGAGMVCACLRHHGGAASGAVSSFRRRFSRLCRGAWCCPGGALPCLRAGWAVRVQQANMLRAKASAGSFCRW